MKVHLIKQISAFFLIVAIFYMILKDINLTESYAKRNFVCKGICIKYYERAI